MKVRYFFALVVGLLVAFTLSPYVVLSQDSLPSTSPLVDGQKDTDRVLASNATEDGIITFGEYPVGTSISTQYAEQGVLFGGDNPFITTDGANPTSPVLSGSPRFQGAIEGIFVNPSDGETPVIVESFSLDAGYFDSNGSTRIEWFDPDGEKLGQRTNTHFGIQRFDIEGGNIARFRISIIENEPAGYAIDNVSFKPVQSSVLFREKRDGDKDGTWGLGDDEIPGWDHAALNVENVVYESHPGNVTRGTTSTFFSEDGSESVSMSYDNGVQGQHSKETFRHDSTEPGAENSPVIDFEEIPIPQTLADSMLEQIEIQMEAEFQFIDFSLAGLVETLSPEAQKGGDGTFTCVGLIEWAAEQAGHMEGQGFIPNNYESVGFFPLLSPSRLNYFMKNPDASGVGQHFQGIFDPVDFIIIDPLGRKLGYSFDLGEKNEIPRAFYSGNGNLEEFFIPNPVAGTYQIEFTGLGDQVYGAIGSSQHFEEIDEFFAQGEEDSLTFVVELVAGAPGDVNFDGNIDEEDIAALSSALNTFTNDPNDPGDINGDGAIGQSDLELLTELVNLQTAIDISIDIWPFLDKNVVVIGKDHPIPVSILSADTFDASSQVDTTTLTFGRTGDETSLDRCLPYFVDVNKDDLRDFTCIFRSGQASFEIGDTEGILRGQTADGASIAGKDAIQTIPQTGARLFGLRLNGESEVPPVTTNATGTGAFTLNRSETRLSYALNARNLEDITAVHIHCGSVDTNGPVGVTLLSGEPITRRLLLGNITTPDADNSCGWTDLDSVVTAIRSGDAYVNVHTVAHPSGEIRGQLSAVLSSAAASALMEEMELSNHVYLPLIITEE